MARSQQYNEDVDLDLLELDENLAALDCNEVCRELARESQQHAE